MLKLSRCYLYTALALNIAVSTSVMATTSNIAAPIANPDSLAKLNTYGPITKGDTIWSIALKVRPDESLTVHQVMQALYHYNPKSFRSDNLNHLITGRSLAVPATDYIAQFNAKAAKRKFLQDVNQWQPKVSQSVATIANNVAIVANSNTEQQTIPEKIEPKETKPNQIDTIANEQPVTTHITPQQAPYVEESERPIIKSESEIDSTFDNLQLSVTASLDYRYFTQDPVFPGQHNGYLAAFIEPELYYSWNQDSDSLTFKPFYRWDQHDSERSHFDIRELMWLHVGEDWELRTGIGSVFWGQTESQHLVDIINQTDLVEAIDGEDKLGQPMVNLTLVKDWGNLDFFVLPGFRERTFPGVEGRLRPPMVIDQDDALYQSSREERHIDYAIRWSHSIDLWDLGIAWFDGTSREPLIIARVNPVTGEARFSPFYPQIQQLGIDALAAVGDWLYKFEGIYRNYDDDNNFSADSFTAITTGFEYTSVGIFESVIDLGWLMEYQYDDRDEAATGPGQNDLMLGARFALNDVAGTEILIAYVQDLDDSSTYSAFIEASSRLNDYWKWRLDARLFSTDNPFNQLYWLRQDDHIQFSIEYYY